MFTDRLTEIPEPVSMFGWKEVPIEECGEPLIVLNELDPRIVVRPEYYMKGIPLASPIQRLRQGAVERLIGAANFLPAGYKLVVFDAYRPLEVQKSLFDTQVTDLKILFPSWTIEELEEEAQRYVSIPSNDPKKPSPHSTGGAIDLSILDPDVRQLNMGTEFDHFGIGAQTAYFKNFDEEIHNNRKLLYSVMIACGFTNYPEEWWHFDFGNQFWGKIFGKTAIYGPATLPSSNNLINGVIDPTDDSVFVRIHSDRPPETFSRRFGLAGKPEDLKTALDALYNLYHPHFGIKQQLAAILLNNFKVRRFAL